MSASNLSNLPDDEEKPPTPSKRVPAMKPTVAHARAVAARAKALGAWRKATERLTPVDPLIAIAALALLATLAVPLWDAHVRSSNEDAALDLMRRLPAIESSYKQHGAPDGQHRFAMSFFELAAAGLFGGPPPEGADLRRDGYVFRIGTPDDPAQRFFAIATPEQFGATGSRSFYVDDKNVVHVSPGLANGPVFPVAEAAN